MRPFDRLPTQLQNEQVRRYYNIITSKTATLIFKRLFDVIIALVLFVVLLPLNIVIAILIKCTSRGPVFYRQVRVGKYNREFKIFKFRTMVVNADKIGAQITVGKRDPRVTSIGYYLRKIRFDELPQLINVLIGDMTLVGTRPEVRRYVNKYSDEMMATLLLAPGVTGLASLEFKDENERLEGVQNPEKCYIEEILPEKMSINLRYIKDMSILNDIKIIVRTVLEVL